MSDERPGKHAVDRFWSDKARQVSRMLDGGTYAPVPLDYVRCRTCRKKLIRILLVDGRVEFESNVALLEEPGSVWALTKPATRGAQRATLRPSPSERISLRCDECGAITATEVAALREALDAVLSGK